MQINLPVMLTAKLGYVWNSDTQESERKVVVEWGNETIVELKPIREVPDYYYNDVDEVEESIAAETAAKWLREKLGV